MTGTVKLSWTGDRAALQQASDALSERLWPPAGAVGLTKDDPTSSDDAATWRLEAYFETAPDMDEISSLVGDAAGVGAPVIEDVPDIDWVAHALSGLGVIRCGRFVLYGAHDADKVRVCDDEITIRIDANEAFGTGHHPTTAGCLELLDRFAGFAPKAILDLGCGSAVLAIAAAKLWGRPVLATDIDARSIEIAEANADLNDVGALVSTVAAEGFDHAAIASAAPFDFVFANILAGPLADLAPAMARHVKKNGRVMLAGVMTEQADGVADAYGAAGFRVINRIEQPTWPVMLLVRQ